MEKHLHNFQFRVLVYKEIGQFVAHALEVDVLAYGKTADAAVDELSNVIDNQLNFARLKRDERLLHFPAEKELFDRWEAAHAAALRDEVFQQDRPGEMNPQALCISLDQKLNSLAQKRYGPVLS
jgi:hypothetical protein